MKTSNIFLVNFTIPTRKQIKMLIFVEGQEEIEAFLIDQT